MVAQVVTIPLPASRPAGAAVAAGDAASTLGEFIIGPENRLIEVVCRSILGGADHYNPIFIYGPSGVGKSHLVRGLLEAWRAQFRRRPVYVTAVDFVRELADAIESQGVDEFRHRFRTAPLLTIENLGELTGRTAALEEFQATLDIQLEAGHRVLLTGSAAPADIAGLPASLRSRLAGGLVVPLAAAGPEARCAILRRLAARRSLSLTPDAIELLAAEFHGTVPDLAGAVARLEMDARLQSRPVSVADVRGLIHQRGQGPAPRVSDIAQVTARHFSLKLSDLRSPSRRQAVVKARGVAMYLARQMTGESLGQIGRYFGGRDHTTVLHGCRKTETLLKSEPAIHQAVAQLQRQLKVAS